jgi:fructose-specific phosphotransferase system IIC component
VAGGATSLYLFRHVDLIFGYPAILLGIVPGLIVARRNWPVLPVLVIGSAVFVLLVLHQSTVPRPVGPRITTPIWGIFAAVNIGSWALGIAIGVTVSARLGRRAQREGPAAGADRVSQ